MLASRELRRNNIAEYLLYMWLVEDLVRANGFDPERIASAVLGVDTDPDTRSEYVGWYEELVGMMTAEGVREKGHLQINRNIVILLSDLNNRILQSSGFSGYKHSYYSALPVIVEFRAKSGDNGKEKEELESCFDFMYGIWMLKMQGRMISQGTADAAKRVSAVLAQLAGYYARELRGELDLDHED